jgi:hypothetical protein
MAIVSAKVHARERSRTNGSTIIINKGAIVMAFMSKDGRGFTNRPSMKAHDARTNRKSADVGITPNPSGRNARMDSGHEAEATTCPHCGGHIDADSVLAKRDSGVESQAWASGMHGEAEF